MKIKQLAKRVLSLLLTLSFVLSCVTVIGNTRVYAKKDLKDYIYIEMWPEEMTVYKGYEGQTFLSCTVGMYYWDLTEAEKKQLDKLYQKVMDELVWKTSNPEVLCFIPNYDYSGCENKPIYADTLKLADGWTYPRIAAKKTGKVEVSVYSATLNKKYRCTVTVKNAGLECECKRFFVNKSYDFSLKSANNQIRAISYKSSDEKIATINKTNGQLKTKKTGKVTISCTADDGKTYSKTITIRKPQLSYSKITTYYFTGLQKGFYSTFPIVADGIDVKSWTSSDTKIIKIKHSKEDRKKRIGILEIHKTGKVTITCIDKNGKKYTCKVTVVGGKKWSGLSGGYCPTKEEIKNHGYYQDINRIQDYGTVIFYIVDYGKQISYNNGYSKKSFAEADEIAKKTLKNRYPDAMINSDVGGDMLGFTDGKKYGRLWMEIYYVDKP